MKNSGYGLKKMVGLRGFDRSVGRVCVAIFAKEIEVDLKNMGWCMQNACEALLCHNFSAPMPFQKLFKAG